MMRPPGLTAPMLAEWLREFARLVSEHEDQLNSLDAAIATPTTAPTSPAASRP